MKKDLWRCRREPLHGYLMLAEALLEKEAFAEAWNDVHPVRPIADALVRKWGDGAAWAQDEATHPHEAMTLQLDSTRARTRLGWSPRLSLHTTLEWIVAWQKQYLAAPESAREVTLRQIEEYEGLAA